MGKKEDILIIDPFIPSNMNFQTILMPKGNLAKSLSEKSWSVRTILNLVCSSKWKLTILNFPGIGWTRWECHRTWIICQPIWQMGSSSFSSTKPSVLAVWNGPKSRANFQEWKSSWKSWKTATTLSNLAGSRSIHLSASQVRTALPDGQGGQKYFF